METEKTTQENNQAILAHFLSSQAALLSNPPPDMTLDEIADTKVMVNAINGFVEQFNKMAYENATMKTQLRQESFKL